MKHALLLAAALAAPALVEAATAPVVIRDHDALALAPAGDRIADVEAVDPGNLPEEAHGAVVVRGADGKVLAQYDPCKTCKYSDTAWAPNTDKLAFVGYDAPAGKTTLYLVATGSLRAAAQIDGVANTVRWAPDGSTVALLVTLGAHKKTGAIEAGAALVGEIGAAEDEQRIATLTDAGITPVSPADTYIYEFDWTPDGKGFVATGAKGNGDNNWWIATLDYVARDNGALRVIAAPKMQMDLPRVSPDGKTVAFIGGLMSDWGPIGGDVYTVPLAGGPPLDITPDFRGSFRGLAWRGSELATAALVDDRNAVVIVDPATRGFRTLWSAPVRTSAQKFDGAIAFSGDGKIAATIIEDFTHASEIAIGPAAHLAPVTHDNAALEAQVAVQSMHWTNENLNVQGWLIGPLRGTGTSDKHPLIVVVHGGPSSAYMPRYIASGGQHGTDFDFVHELVERGYFFFFPNPRGSYGQGETFTRANIRDFGRGDLRDILAGIDAIEKLAPIDDGRLGIYGHSYGGWMTMWAVTQTQRFKAAFASAGIANMTSYYGQNGIDQWMIPFFGASIYDDAAAYRAASPIEFIKQVKTPMLLSAGERDVECPSVQSLEYWHALRALQVPTRLFIYAGEGHHFRDPKDLAEWRAHAVDWFTQYLR
jgi:dipeptidyl aminopeptidase/acylaminoacyl peptidase